MIVDIVDHQLLVLSEFRTGSVIVGILVRLDLKQRHGAVRGGRDGQRDVNRLAIGV